MASLELLLQRIDEIDRKLTLLSRDVQKIAAHFADKELSEEESILDKI